MLPTNNDGDVHCSGRCFVVSFIVAMMDGVVPKASNRARREKNSWFLRLGHEHNDGCGASGPAHIQSLTITATSNKLGQHVGGGGCSTAKRPRTTTVHR
jgi:hypothetical protein